MRPILPQPARSLPFQGDPILSFVAVPLTFKKMVLFSQMSVLRHCSLICASCFVNWHVLSFFSIHFPHSVLFPGSYLL